MSKEERMRQQQRSRVKRAAKKISALLLVAAIVIGGGWLLVRYANKQAASLPGEKFTEQPAQHVTGTDHPAYNSNPPTSGWHWAQPANWGIYDRELPDEQVIHNLEHAGVWISYKPDAVDAGTVERLKAVVGRYPTKVILTQRTANDAPIALAAWTRLQKLESFDEAAIESFIKSYRGKIGPEPNAP
jgi:hypothetical protein